MKRECKCVYCGDCNGSGQVECRNPDFYPEWDLESCSNCRGTGISEVCEDCELADELAGDPWD